MVGVFGVTKADVIGLSSDDLRELITMLVTAEAYAHGLSDVSVTAGGHPSAKDGGSDVRIDWTGTPPRTPYLPAANCVFQCKAQRVPPSRIRNELRPGGVLRPLFFELGRLRGAYVFASTDDCTASMLSERRRVLETELAETGVAADFFDAQKLAEWASRHPMAALWLREKSGRPLTGWRSHGEWAFRRRGADDQFLSDGTERVTFDDSNDHANEGFYAVGPAGVTVATALDRFRSHLAQPRTAGRLVGVSGAGKTRFAEALFAREGGLDPDRTIYNDVGSPAERSPVHLAEMLVALRRPVVMVLDNCPHATHRSVAEVARRAGSTISLLSIDYDIAPDSPPDTLGARISPPSEGLIETFLECQYPDLNVKDRRRICMFSGGNFRIAAVLANTVVRTGNIRHLDDKQLIERLFQSERRQVSELQHRSAKFTALAYALEDEDSERQSVEFTLLANLADLSVRQLRDGHAWASQIGIAQRRGSQIAILPPALAAHLAEEALEMVAKREFLAFLSGAPDRLLTSACRRLGQMPQSLHARALAEALLSEDGIVGSPASLVDRAEALARLSPTAPDAALAAVRRLLDSPCAIELNERPESKSRIARTLEELSAREIHFPASAALLAQLADPFDPKDTCLLHLLKVFDVAAFRVFSDNRLPLVDQLVASTTQRDRWLALRVLARCLAISIDNLQQARDGPDPVPSPSTTHTGEMLSYAGATLTSLADDVEIRPAASTILASALPDIAIAGFDNLINRILETFAADSFWSEAWISVQHRLRDRDLLHGGDPTGRILVSLQSLEQRLRPTVFEDRFASYVLKDWGDETNVHEVAMGATTTPDLERICLERSANAIAHGRAFGLAMAKLTLNPQHAWSALLDGYRKSKDERRRYFHTFNGFCAGLQDRNPELLDILIDSALTEEGDGDLFCMAAAQRLSLGVILQIEERLRSKTLDSSRMAILRLGPGVNATASQEFVRLGLRLLREGVAGLSLTLEMLFVRRPDLEGVAEPAMLALARRALCCSDLKYIFGYSDTLDSFLSDAFGPLVTWAVSGPNGRRVARHIAHSLVEAKIIQTLTEELEDEISHPRWSGIAKIISRDHQRTILDEFLALERSSLRDARNAAPGYLWDAVMFESSSSTVLSDWTAIDPIVRAPIVATHCRSLFEGGDWNSRFEVGDGNPNRMAAAARFLQANAGTPGVLEGLRSHFIGRMETWSASREPRTTESEENMMREDIIWSLRTEPMLREFGADANEIVQAWSQQVLRDGARYLDERRRSSDDAAGFE